MIKTWGCAGHILLVILAGFTFDIMTSGLLFFFLGLLPLGFILAFCGLELAIAVIQAQVFVILTSSYIRDALELHGDSDSGSGSSNRGIEKSNLYPEGTI